MLLSSKTQADLSTPPAVHFRYKNFLPLKVISSHFKRTTISDQQAILSDHQATLSDQ
jgi:hypothetical protein